MKKIEKLPIIEIKNKEDFYQLGLRDSVRYKSIAKQMTDVLSENKYLRNIFKTVVQFQSRNVQKEPKYSEFIDEYVKGLGTDLKDFSFVFLFPEVVASFNKWVPKLLSFIPGCSSSFIKTADGIIHSRILDYTASDELLSSERLVRIKLKDKYVISGYSFSALPFPTISAINDQGLTLALHYKHGNFFNQSGISIFTICLDILLNCKNIIEAKKKLRDHQSIAHWGIYLSDRDEKVAEFDIRGADISGDIFDMNDHEYLYFNNRIVNEDKELQEIQPFGAHDFCYMRKHAYSKLYKESRPNDILSSHKALSGTYHIRSDRKWYVSPLTISSSQVISFNNKTNESLITVGDVPKFNNQTILRLSNIHEARFQLAQELSEASPYQDATKDLSLAQRFIDIGNIEQAYFKLQMASLKYKDYHEKFICDFYLLVLQYIHTQDEEELYYILKGFERVKNSLPPYLRDHCILFIFRINKLLNSDTGMNHFYAEIVNSQLKKILVKEDKLKGFSIKMLKKLIYPRIELLDIIYTYT